MFTRCPLNRKFGSAVGAFIWLLIPIVFAVRCANTAYHAEKALQYSNSLLECDLRKVPACALGRISDTYKLLEVVSIDINASSHGTAEK